QHWSDEARTSYRQVIDQFGSDSTAAISARFGLAILAEDKGDYTEARQTYQSILSSPVAKDTPFELQAQYRLDHLGKVKTPAAFPPAPARAAAPSEPPAPAAAVTPPAEPIKVDLRQPAATMPAATRPAAP